MMKSQFIFDSSPLITLASFPIHKPAIETALSLTDIMIVETVATETTKRLNYRDAVVIKTLINESKINILPIPPTELDELIDAYKIGKGERDTIRLGLKNPEMRLVMDDEAAFIVATRFKLSPTTLPDLLVEWVEKKLLEKAIALKIVNAFASRYSGAVINHTRHKLNEIEEDSR